MSIFLKAAGKWGSIIALVALVIALLKQVIAFIGFLTFAIKALIVLVFLALFLGVGFLILRAWKENQHRKNNS